MKGVANSSDLYIEGEYQDERAYISKILVGRLNRIKHIFEFWVCGHYPPYKNYII